MRQHQKERGAAGDRRGLGAQPEQQPAGQPRGCRGTAALPGRLLPVPQQDRAALPQAKVGSPGSGDTPWPWGLLEGQVRWGEGLGLPQGHVPRRENRDSPGELPALQQEQQPEPGLLETLG